jgi:hypothetical protein
MSEETVPAVLPPSTTAALGNRKIKPETEDVLLKQAARVSARNEETVIATADLLTELNPANPVEHMLATQMVSCHKMAMEYGRLAMANDLPLSVTEGYLNRSAKMMRLFGQHVETLARLRNKGQQTIQVQHVHLNNVHQAVVGSVQHGG